MKRVVVYAMAGLCCALLAGCGAEKKNTAVGFYLDTVVTITGYCPQSTLEEAIALCGEYESIFSRTVEGSDVWNINNSDGASVEVDDHTAELLRGALKICSESGGAFDVTVAPAVDMWDFKSGCAKLPDRYDLADAAALTDYSKLIIEGNWIQLPDGMAIDLGGIGKGYVADRVVEYLAGQGVESAIVNLGGNVAALGEKPGGEKWSVGIRDPEGGVEDYLATVSAVDCSVVTSGVYERGFDLGGTRYHHILDPATGWPVQNGLVSVTVVAEDSWLADGLSTACFVLGVEDGYELALKMGAEAVFITEDGELICTPGMEVNLELC